MTGNLIAFEITTGYQGLALVNTNSTATELCVNDWPRIVQLPGNTFGLVISTQNKHLRLFYRLSCKY